jgi:hypothetical protein
MDVLIVNLTFAGENNFNIIKMHGTTIKIICNLNLTTSSTMVSIYRMSRGVGDAPDFGRLFLKLKYTDITKTPISKVERLRR